MDSLEVGCLVKVKNPQSALKGRIGRVTSIAKTTGTVRVRLIGKPYNSLPLSFGPSELRHL